MPQVEGAEATAEATTAANAPAATQGEAADQQTATATKSDDTSTNGASADDANGSGSQTDNSNGTGEADSSGGRTEAQDGSSAEKDANRVGYQLRQIRNNDPYVSKLRDNLQENWVNDPNIDQQEARMRRMEANDYVEKVEKSRAQLVVDNDRAAQEIPLFRAVNSDGTKNPDFNKPLLDRALQRYSRDQLITERDENGVEQIVGYKVPLFDYLREEADAYLAGVETARGKQQTADNQTAEADKKANAQMDANSEVAGGASATASKPTQKSAFDEAFEAGFNSIK